MSAREAATVAPGTTAGLAPSAAALGEDLDQLASLGIDAIVLTLEWARLQPTPAGYDGAAVEARTELLQAARARGLRVWACLVDGTLPGWFADDEGGLDDERGRGLLWPRHIDWVGETFGALVDGWIPQREPLLWALRRNLLGQAPPGRRDVRAAARAVQAAMLAEARHGLDELCPPAVPPARSRREPRQLAAACIDMGREHSLGGVSDEMGQHLGPGLVRDPEILVTAPVQHDRAPFGRIPRERRGQRRLADAGLARDQDHPSFTSGDSRQRRVQGLPLVGPSHEHRR